MHLTIVAAVADNSVIGRGGALPWRLKSDMQHFRGATMGKPVLMGRKTYLSIGKPLIGRTNIVVTHDPDFAAPGVLTASSLDAALSAARGDALRRSADAIAVIGGADIYAQTLPLADGLVITHVHLRPTGDTKFPTIAREVWAETGRSEHEPGPDDEAGFTIVTYKRIADDGASANGTT
jgi:dihydrofolate reductase